MELIKSFLNGNSAAIIVSFIGAFFGFLFALFLQWFFGFFHDKRKKRQLFNSMKDELKSLEDGLNKKVDSEYPYFRYEYSVWETAKFSGELMTISKEKYFKSLSKIYSRIYFADLLEQRYFDLYISCLKNESVELSALKSVFDEARREKKKDIIDEIKLFGDA